MENSIKRSKTINGRVIKISKTTENFFRYEFKGDGKYHTTEQGSKHYKNTLFQSFCNYNRGLLYIVESGNDAPRGGKTGNYVIVKFNEQFYNNYQWFIDELKAENERIEKAKAERQKKIEAIGDQEKLLRNYFQNNPKFLSKIKYRIENYSSKKWRNWVKMKVWQKITNESFSLLTLTPSEIRDIAYSI